MTKVRCAQCGTVVRVAGLGAICPNCSALVTPSAPETPPRALPVEPLRPEHAAEEPILDLLEEVAPPQAPPPPQPILQTPEWEMFQKKEPTSAVYVVVGVLAVAVVALAVLVLILLARKPQTITVTIPLPAAAPAVGAPPTPQGSEWFSESPPPNTQAETPTPRPAAPQPGAAPRTSPPATQAVGVPATVPKPRPHEELAKLNLRRPVVDPRAITDEKITESIRRGTAFLLSQFAQTRLKGADLVDAETFAGLNALATYAMLQAGKSMNDPRLTPQSDLVRNLLDRLKEYPMKGNRATYSRSLRISALTVYSRPEDRATITDDLGWLLRSSMNGAYTYEMPPAGRTREQGLWDNSNSQYGALGAWAAAEAGFPVPVSFWQAVERHWINSQLISGGWGYNAGQQSATLSMSAAGTNMLMVSRDQISAATNQAPPIALSTNLIRALEWLDEGDNAIRYNGDHRGYSLYSLERAGLASGFKYFGKHDWYLEFARQLIEQQAPDGSWSSNDGIVADTSFDLLFLLRGREPVLYAKLRFDGAWNNRPRDVAQLTRYTSYQLERAHNWQVADAQRDWWDWADAPVLLITSDTAPVLSDSTMEKLRNYAINGGLIFLQAEKESAEFEVFATALYRRLFPNYPLELLPPDHPIYSAVVPMDEKPQLKGVSNGARLLLLYSPVDLSRLWQAKPNRNQRMQSDLGMNIGIYAAGRRDLRTRLDPIFVPEPSEPALANIPLARVKYEGNWDPEPVGWTRTARLLRNATGLGIDLIPTPASSLNYEITPIAHLTGTASVSFSEADIQAIRRFVTRGGVLLIDACGGSTAFTDSIRNGLLPTVLGGVRLTPLPGDHPIQTGEIPGGSLLPRPQLRENFSATDALPRFAQVGEGVVLFCPQDVSAGLVGVNSLGIHGYVPAWSGRFVQNLLLWTVRHVREVPVPE